MGSRVRRKLFDKRGSGGVQPVQHWEKQTCNRVLFSLEVCRLRSITTVCIFPDVLSKDMRDESQQVIERFWTTELGAESGFLAVIPQVCCTAQHLYSGVQLFRRDNRLIVVAPSDRAEFIQEAIEGFSVDDLFSAEWLQRVFGKDVERILGAAEVNYADDTSFRCNGRQAAQAISSSDSIAYRALASALDSKEIQDSGFSAETFPAFGAFSKDILCAAASYTVWEPSIAHIIVATHPDYRRRGFASAAISALAADAFDRGLILQWRAISSNKNSLALARHLGFAHYCSTLFVRLRES